MKKQPAEQIILSNAYKEILLFDQNANKVVSTYQGPKQFQGLFSSISKNSKSKSGVQIQRQPLYFDQVDHNIEEVGIMTVKQVKYLTDQEWEQWMKERENLPGFLESQKKYKYESRHNLALSRPRNDKGQFLSKAKQEKTTQKTDKNKKIKKKRGRKPKNQKIDNNEEPL